MHSSLIGIAAATLLLSVQPAMACDPAVMPAAEVLARRDLSFVVGRYAADGTFIVEDALGGAAPPRPYRLFERGPFGSQCEISVMSASSPSPQDVAKKTRFLLPVESRNDGKRELLVVMGYPNRLVVRGDRIVDQYFGTSSSLSDLRRRLPKAR